MATFFPFLPMIITLNGGIPGVSLHALVTCSRKNQRKKKINKESKTLARLNQVLEVLTRRQISFHLRRLSPDRGMGIPLGSVSAVTWEDQMIGCEESPWYLLNVSHQ